MRGRLPWIAALGVVSLLAMAGLALFGSDFEGHRTAGANLYSRSALGHHAFERLLRERDPQVERLRREADYWLDPGDLLVWLEPLPPDSSNVVWASALEASSGEDRRTMLVLPKWRPAEPHPYRAQHVGRVRLRAIADAQAQLDFLGIPAEVVEGAPGGAWAGLGPLRPPELAHPHRYLRSAVLEPVVARGDHILAGWYRAPHGGQFLVVSDPDLLNNHGLGEADNAALAVALVEGLREPGAWVGLDVGLQGFFALPSLGSLLARGPLGPPAIVLLLMAACALWMATPRFGAPRPTPPPFTGGSEELVAATTQLLLRGRHAGWLLQRYAEQQEAEAARRLHLPEDLPPAERRARLARRHDDSVLDEAARVAARHPRPDRLIHIARAIHAWREEMRIGHR